MLKFIEKKLTGMQCEFVNIPWIPQTICPCYSLIFPNSILVHEPRDPHSLLNINKSSPEFFSLPHTFTPLYFDSPDLNRFSFISIFDKVSIILSLFSPITKFAVNNSKLSTVVVSLCSGLSTRGLKIGDASWFLSVT